MNNNSSNNSNNNKIIMIIMAHRSEQNFLNKRVFGLGLKEVI